MNALDGDAVKVIVAEIDRLEKLQGEIEEELLRYRGALSVLTTDAPLRTRPRASMEIRERVHAVILDHGPITTSEIAERPDFRDVKYGTIGAATTWLFRTNQIRANGRSKRGRIWARP